MRKMNFNKGFLPCAILSCVIIVFGIVGLFVRGINIGLDFKPGLIEEVRAANPVADITYDGSARITVELSAGQMDLVISGVGATNETRSFNFAEFSTVDALAAEVNKVPGVKVNVKDGSYVSTKLFLNSIATTQLTNEPLYLYPAGTSKITTDDLRDALNDKGINIKQLGSGEDASYQIRMGVEAADGQSTLQDTVNTKLY